VLLTVPQPHNGQVPIARDKTQHRTLRCGRRFGKSSFGIIETIGDFKYGIRGVAVTPRYMVGWFAPEYKYLDEIWRELKTRLTPITISCDDSKHRMVLSNGSVVEGWSLLNNPDAGRSRKYHKIIVDEAGLIPNLRRWWDAAAEATLLDFNGRALLMGTPNPIGPDFDSFAEQAEQGDKSWKLHTGATFTNNYLHPTAIERIRAKRNHMPEWLWLQEYMGVPCEAASGFFGKAMLKEHAIQHAREPYWMGNIDIRNVVDRDYSIENRQIGQIKMYPDPGRGQWSLWCDLIADRPDQSCDYVIGIDIGAGVGSSNTVMSVFCIDTGRKVAEFASPMVGSETAARLAAIAGLWFGGRFGAACLCPEVNGGQGESFTKGLMDLQYPRIFRRRYTGARKDHNLTTTELGIGFLSSSKSRHAALEAYRGALASGAFINPSPAALREAATYAYDRTGKVVPFRMDEDPGADNARMPHGDRVIADMLAWHAFSHNPDAPIPEEPKDHPDSFAARKAERLKKQTKPKGFRFS